MIKKSVKTIETLSSLVFSGCNIQEFLDAAEDITVNPIWFAPIKEYSKNIWSKSFPKEYFPPDYIKRLYNEYKSYLMKYMSRLGDEPIITENLPEQPFDIKTCWVRDKVNTYGTLNIANTRVPHETKDNKLMVFICKCLAHICSQQQPSKASLSPDEVLSKLLSGQINSYLELSVHLPKFPEKKETKWCLVILNFKSDRIMQAGLYLRKLFSESLPNSWITWNDRHFVALVDCSVQDIDRKGKVVEFLTKTSEHFGCPVCISQVFNQLLKCKTYYERMISLPFFDMAHEPVIIFFEDYPEFNLIHRSNLSAADLEDFTHSLYKKMLHHDAKNNTTYTETLIVYLNNGLNAKKTAKQLCIHINTMQYRLNQIQEFFDLDFNNENILFAFLFSARLKRYVIAAQGSMES